MPWGSRHRRSRHRRSRHLKARRPHFPHPRFRVQRYRRLPLCHCRHRHHRCYRRPRLRRARGLHRCGPRLPAPRPGPWLVRQQPGPLSRRCLQRTVRHYNRPRRAAVPIPKREGASWGSWKASTLAPPCSPPSTTLWLKNSSQPAEARASSRRCISAWEMASVLVASVQVFPKASETRPSRVPKNISVTGITTAAPAATARANDSSAFGTKICATNSFPPAESLRVSRWCHSVHASAAPPAREVPCP